jgi:hypothetical protein
VGGRFESEEEKAKENEAQSKDRCNLAAPTVEHGKASQLWPNG